MSHAPSTAPSVATAFWPLVLACAAILMVTMGIRQTLGLYLSPINTHTGLGIATLSLAMAVGQLMWGLAQPVAGALADRYGAPRIVVGGGLMMSCGLLATTFAGDALTMTLALGVLTAAGAGAGSMSLLMGAAAQRLPAHRRSFASGFINAGGSFGQFVFAPLNQWLIAAWGWVQGMGALALLALITLPLAWPLRRVRPADGAAPAAPPVATATAAAPTLSMRAQLRVAFADRSYACLHLGFFTCGFHIAFLVTHLPAEVNLCGLSANVAATSLAVIGLFNIAGSLCAGALGSVYPMKWLLFWTYFVRAVAIVVYVFAPKTPMTFYVFAAVLGFTWLSTVPPTAGLVGKLFGTQYLGTLFGLTLLSHQVGGFLGAWVGGLVITHDGNYVLMWWMDAALALAAALINLPIREARMPPRGAPAAA